MKLFPRQWQWLFKASLCLLLAIIVILLLDVLLEILNPTLNFSSSTTPSLSSQSIATLSETSGHITITQILPEDTPQAAHIGRLLRTIARTSRANAGASIEITYLDPRQSSTEIAFLQTQGIHEAGILFQQDARRVFLSESTFFTGNEILPTAEFETILLSAIARLSRIDGLKIGWIVGHGEPDFTDTDPVTGFSGMRRALELEGYQIVPLPLATLTQEQSIPKDLSVLILMTPRFQLNPLEQRQLFNWMDHGGRLLGLFAKGNDAGMNALLQQYGISIGTRTRTPVRRILNGMGLAERFSEKHPITQELANQTNLLFGAAPMLVQNSPVFSTTVTPLVTMEVLPLQSASLQSNEWITVVAAIERGDNILNEDLAFRPSRIVLSSDVLFLENRSILNYASANRNFLINTMHWLSGISGSTGHSLTQVIRVGQDWQAWRRTILFIAVLLPALFCGILWLLFRKRS